MIITGVVVLVQDTTRYIKLLQRCTSGLNIAADLGPVLALFKWAFPNLFSVVFVNNAPYKNCQCQESKVESLVSEATTLPSLPQQLPNGLSLISILQ